MEQRCPCSKNCGRKYDGAGISLHLVEETMEEEISTLWPPKECMQKQLLLKNHSPWEGPVLLLGKKCEEEGVAERSHYGLMVNLLSATGCMGGGEELEISE